MTYGLKISKSGSAATSTDFRDLILHSDYSMFKYHSDTSTSMTLNPGDTTKTISFAHGLGYVPAFISYMKDSGGTTLLPNRRTYFFTGTDEHIYSYADSTNIYITWKSVKPLNQISYIPYFFYSDAGGTGADNAFVGNLQGSSQKCSMTFYRDSGEVLFQGDSIYSATLDFWITQKGPGTSDTKIKTYGIDVDELGFIYDDWGQPKTTTSTSQNVAANEGSSFGINTKDIVQEIVNRPGWVDDSNLGFYVEDNSSPYECNIWDYDIKSKLTIITNGTTTYNFRVIVFKDKIA